MSSTEQLGVRRCDPLTRWVQRILGVACYLFMVLPYTGQVTGLERLGSGQRYLFVSNHVSLLDTLLLGGILFRRGILPILVLGDATVWRSNVIRRLLSARLGFLIQRDRPSRQRLQELESFGRCREDFHLLVFPEGTRGDGRRVRRCQPGIFHVAQAAAVPMVPVFIAGMEQVSSKSGRPHPLRGWRKVRVHFGEPWPPQSYLPLDKDELPAAVRERIESLRPEDPVQES
jgi:1-acyl-sn-glycerol-3-phosphate acyltransferase